MSLAVHVHTIQRVIREAETVLWGRLHTPRPTTLPHRFELLLEGFSLGLLQRGSCIIPPEAPLTVLEDEWRVGSEHVETTTCLGNAATSRPTCFIHRIRRRGEVSP